MILYIINKIILEKEPKNTDHGL